MSARLITPAQLEPFLPEALDFLRRMVEENSYTLNRDGVARNADIVEAQFRDLGFTADRVPAENAAYGEHLFLSRPGPGPGVLLVSHLDTVFPVEEEERNQFRWQPEGDRIYGPGTMDIKGGTAMIWLTLKALLAEAPDLFQRTHWVLAFNAAEEVMVTDFGQRCRERVPPDCRAGLVFESCNGPGDQLRVARCRKGMADVEITVEGRGAHAGAGHRDGANALVELSRLISRMAEYTDYAVHRTFSVGCISGGGVSNRVPHEAACVVNVRAADEETLEQAIGMIFAFEKEPPTVRAASDGYPCRVRVKVLKRIPAWPQNPGTDHLLATWLAASESVGVALDKSDGPAGGLSDGNFIAQFLPALDNVGAHGHHNHSSERSADGAKLPEYVTVSSLVKMGATNATALRTLLGDVSP